MREWLFETGNYSWMHWSEVNIERDIKRSDIEYDAVKHSIYHWRSRTEIRSVVRYLTYSDIRSINIANGIKKQTLKSSTQGSHRLLSHPLLSSCLPRQNQLKACYVYRARQLQGDKVVAPRSITSDFGKYIGLRVCTWAVAHNGGPESFMAGKKQMSPQQGSTNTIRSFVQDWRPTDEYSIFVVFQPYICIYPSIQTHGTVRSRTF